MSRETPDRQLVSVQPCEWQEGETPRDHIAKLIKDRKLDVDFRDQVMPRRADQRRGLLGHRGTVRKVQGVTEGCVEVG